MGFWKALFGRLGAKTPKAEGGPADNPFSDEDARDQRDSPRDSEEES